MTLDNTQNFNADLSKPLDTLTDSEMEIIAQQLNAIEPGAGALTHTKSYFWSDLISFMDSMMIFEIIAIGSILFLGSIIAVNVFPISP